MSNRTLENAQQEVERGNLWRAKEILQGAIGSEKRYDVELFEMMGTVLLRMGDLPEAGRFLFLSGRRKPEYLESIEIFFSRHRRKHPRDFVAHLPRNGRLPSLSDYPEDVARALREIGFPESLQDKNARSYLPQTRKDMIFWVACGTIALVTLVLIILGALKLLEIIKT